MHCIVFECFSDFGYMILISVIITDSLLLILCIPIMHTYQFEEEVHWWTLAVVRLCTVTSVQVPRVRCLKTSSVLNTLRQTERELGKWLSNDDDKFDWSVFFKYVAVLEGKRCNIFMSIYIRLTDFYSMTVLQWILIWLERTWRESSIDYKGGCSLWWCVEGSSHGPPQSAIWCSPNHSVHQLRRHACTDFETFKANIQWLVGVLKPGG